MATDIWPELDLTSVARTPRTVILEQSELLEKKTGGLLLWYVEVVASSKRDIRYDVTLYAPKLRYHTRMLWISHDSARPYPATVADESEKVISVADSEEHLLAALRAYVAQPRWVETSNRLLAMSKAS